MMSTDLNLSEEFTQKNTLENGLKIMPEKFILKC
jgi:hypothetical protein